MKHITQRDARRECRQRQPACSLEVAPNKGNRERVVPVDRPFFSELAVYLRTERPVGCATPECFVVLRGPTQGGPLSEAGMRRVFRTHRASSGALRVRPHRLRHTYGTELAAAGIDLLVLRDLMGHASPETSAGYVNPRELHLASDTIKDAYDDAMTKVRSRRPVFVAGAGGSFVPDRVQWLHAEMLKTRLTGGYCARHPAAGPCPYANVCEQCDNFAPGKEFTGALASQLADVVQLRNDATDRGWTADADRHARVVESLQAHLSRLDRATP